jgi:hypothetical protein
MDAPRFYELDCFDIKATFKDRDKGFVLADSNIGLRTKIYIATKGRFKPRIKPYVERFKQFDKAVLSLPDNTYLDGFWQSEKYFADIRKTLLKEFSFKTKPSTTNAKILKAINNCESVSLHVRRLDYVTNKSTQAIHGFVSLEYYKRAIARMSATVDKPHFFVFSDEPAWAKENLKIDSPVTYVDHNKKGFEDMRLMRACKHNIVANSSFSWWGAWLNDNPGKIIIGPEKWFNDISMNASDIIPSGWVKL